VCTPYVLFATKKYHCGTIFRVSTMSLILRYFLSGSSSRGRNHRILGLGIRRPRHRGGRREQSRRKYQIEINLAVRSNGPSSLVTFLSRRPRHRKSLLHCSSGCFFLTKSHHNPRAGWPGPWSWATNRSPFKASNIADANYT
jgi:hypothetical protein